MRSFRLKKSKNPILPFFLFIGIILMGRCASTGYPSGGPKDETPPEIVKSIPAENSLSFLGDEIEISFNELIKVTDVFQKLMVSPPVNEQPKVTTNAKKLIIKFQEDLQPNTTYTLDFADAISDNNEGNVLENFTFSFSTGEVIDSLKISGFLFDAATLSPVDGALVMVHSNPADSAFKKQVPLRVTKTDSKGRFSVQNLSPGSYRVFALEDANRNYKYDQPGERIAWYPEMIEPHIGSYEVIDSISADSVVVRDIVAYLPDSLQLFLFQEDNAQQYLKESARKSRNKVDFIFERSLKEPLDVRLLKEDGREWFVYESSAKLDSISLWITDSTLIKQDSLLLSLRYMVLDSLKQPKVKVDTLNAYFFDMGSTETRKSKKEDKTTELPSLAVEGLKSSLDILESLSIKFPTPLLQIQTDRLNLYLMEDTIPMPHEFKLVQDSLRLRRYEIQFQRKAGAKYLFTADSAAFKDIYGLATKPIKQNIEVKKEDAYGIFYVDVEDPGANWLLQILNKQELVIRQQVVPANGKVGFRYIRPGDYFLRIVFDENGNRRWDEGDFEKGIQPEKIVYFPESINIRANWERMIPWDPKSFDIHSFVELHRSKSTSSRGRR